MRSPTALTDATPLVSVIIVSYETREITDACVRSVKAHHGALPIEIIVVDNHSTDGTAAALRERHPNIVVVDAPVNGGFAYGNALGFQRARGRYVLLLNPDAELEPGALEHAIAFLETHPDAGMVGASVQLPDGRQQSSTIRFPTLGMTFCNIVLPVSVMRASPIFGDPRYARLDRSKPQAVDAVSGCFMLARREVLDGAGWLDTRFFMYGEEVEWCRRIRRAGWTIVHHPQVRILHHGGASTRDRSVWKAREMMRGQLLYFALAEGRSTARMVAAMMVARDLVRLPTAIIRRGTAAELGARLALGLKSMASPPRGQSVALPPADDAR